MIVQNMVTHFPGKSYTNTEVLDVCFNDDKKIGDLLYDVTRKHFIDDVLSNQCFFNHLGVEHRNLLAPPGDNRDWWERNVGKDPYALEGALAYEKLMENKEPLTANDRIIVISNVSDTTAPNIGYAVIGHLKARNSNFVTPTLISLDGEGCSGYISGLHEAEIYLSHRPDARVVILTVEMAGTTLHNPWLIESLLEKIKSCDAKTLEDNCKKLLGLGIQRYLFGDGCSASICVKNGKGIEFDSIHKWSNIHPDDRHLLEVRGIGTKEIFHTAPFGYFYQEPEKLFNRLKVSYFPQVLSKLNSLEQRPNNFAIHTGSNKIIDFVKSSLNLNENDVAPSREILKHQGNMNSTTGACILAKFLFEERSGKTVALFFGVGFSVQLAI